MGFNDMHVVTERDPCGAVFAAEVAVFFLRPCSNGTTLLSKSAIENILTSAGQVVRKAQSMGEVSASPFESLSAVLLRDEVVATIQECACVLLGTILFKFRHFHSAAFCNGTYCVSQVARWFGR
jgi:hypothetical protein